jgi:hypothetical protein
LGQIIMKFELQTLEEYSDETLIKELQRVSDAMNGERLTRKQFDSMARVHSSTLENHFGSWVAALDKAGISEVVAPRYKVLSREEVIQALREFISENPGESVTEKAISTRLGLYRGAITRRFGKWAGLLSEVDLAPVRHGRRYTDEECFENILTLWMHYGRQPHFGELKQPPSTVGPKAYILRWGGWRSALSEFVKQVNKPRTTSIESSSLEINCNNRKDAVLDTPVPRTIPLALRYKILCRDKFRCVVCGASPAKDLGVELHVDHIHPWSRGGQNIEENLRTLCFKCNLGKGDKLENASHVPLS